MNRIATFITRAALAAALIAPVTALSDARGKDDGPTFKDSGDHGRHGGGGEKGGGGRHGIPEFDPAAVGTVAALLAGGGILLARRRRRS